jgi:hypothetical protein
MPETDEQYRKRLAGYVEGKNALAIQAQTAAKLGPLIQGLSFQQLTSRTFIEKWSIVEIRAHLAEDEIATSWRYRQMVEYDGGHLTGFDQNLWAELGKYATWSAGEAVELFRLLREANLRMLGALSPEQWRRSGEHAERGRLTVEELARHMAAHDINHLEQIERLLEEQRRQGLRNQKPSLPAKATSAYGESLELPELTKLLERTPVVLRHSISALPDRAVGYHPGSEKWCIKQILGHLTEEDKRDFVGRIERMLREPGLRLEVNDQNKVARERHDCDKNVGDLLDEFASVRANSVEFLKQLRAADLGCHGIHSTIGSISVRELLHEWVYHDLNHTKQIDVNTQRFLWDHLGNMQGFYSS